MNFTNPEILRTSNDMKIGKVESEGDSINYITYMSKVKLRLLKLVVEFVKADMSEGASNDQSIKDCLGLVHSTLHIDDKQYPVDEDGIVSEIERSEEFQNWSTEIKYRFLNTHTGVVKITTPIPVTGNLNPNVSEETMELLKEDDTFQVFLDGLASLI